MNSRTEVKLVEAALTGDIESFGELYCRHYTAVVGAAYSLVGNRHLAEDAAQEAFAIACRDLVHLRCADKFACWIRTIARRVARRMVPSDREVALLEDIPACPTGDHGQRRNDLVRRAVLHLPEAAREVVVLHYFTGLSHRQIADMLRISPEAVHGRLVRARRKLAEELRHDVLGSLEP